MFKSIFTSALLFSCIIIFSCSDSEEDSFQKPSSVIGLDDQSEEKRIAKEEFLSKLYYAEGNLNVDSIREESLKKRILERSIRRANYTKSQVGEIFANGFLEANWYERGPDNEAGDMREIAYDIETNDLYAISVGRHLWKGNLDGQTWTLLNDEVRFESEILELCHIDSTLRLFAAYGSGTLNKTIRYSDDYGQTWTNGTGFDFYDHWGRSRKMIKVNDSVMYYLVHTWQGNPWGKVMQIYETKNSGESYTKVWNSTVGYDGEDVDIWKPHDSDLLVFIDNRQQTIGHFYFDASLDSTIFTSMSGYSGSGVPTGGVHLSGFNTGGFTGYEYYIVHDQTSQVYKKFASNNNWNYLGTCPENIWRKGWMVNPNTGELYIGGFQLNKSMDGISWEEQYPYWWTYYADSKDSMHVDIMHMKYFEDSSSTPFIIVLNHAGVYITWDNFSSTQNLGLNDLNVVTLYDQTTSSDGKLYGGAQDKGNFVYLGDSKANFNIVSTNNLTTGDGMIGEFINGNQSMMNMIQLGTVGCIADLTAPSNSGVSWYTIGGTDKPGWINPMVGTPDTNDNVVYMAGGNINGGTGSYLIEMDVSISGTSVQWNPSQFNYDFLDNSHSGSSVIKAIGVSNADHNRIYIATEDASFFVTTNSGINWTRMPKALPNGLLPWEIITSNSNPDLVYICGTGFSNSGVYVSSNAGQSFQPISFTSPLATYYEIALSDNEDLLFAATSEGPYVFNINDQTWYSLTGISTPIVDFNTVDNIGNDVIRFGTYGRGVWDFEITRIGNPTAISDNQIESLEVYPNPISPNEILHFRNLEKGEYRVEIYDLKGTIMLSTKLIGNDLKLPELSKGFYLVKLNGMNMSKKCRIIVE